MSKPEKEQVMKQFIKVMSIKPSEALPWLLAKHYAHRKCPISYAFGVYRDDGLIGVVTFGLPASPSLCAGICGPDFKDVVLELNRLCCENTKNIASFLVGRALSLLPANTIVVSYADTGQGHIGYVYQATNFIYTGLTDSGRRTPRCDRINEAGKHGRHQGRKADGTIDESIPLVYRKPKHRYIFFCGSSKQKKEMRKVLRYQIEPYPKGESIHYNTGVDVQKQGILF